MDTDSGYKIQLVLAIPEFMDSDYENMFRLMLDIP